MDCGRLLELLVVQWGRGGGGPWWCWWLVTAKAAVFHGQLNDKPRPYAAAADTGPEVKCASQRGALFFKHHHLTHGTIILSRSFLL